MTPVHKLENAAICAAVQFGGGTYARNALAIALKAYRAEGSILAANWLRNHVNWIAGNLWKA